MITLGDAFEKIVSYHVSTLKAFTTNTMISMTCKDKCVAKEQESAEEGMKAVEGRGMTCFL